MKILNKFNNVEDLAEAYKNLEKEFTKRCEKISQLQKQVDDLCQQLSLKEEALQNNSSTISEQDKEDIIQEFLRGVIDSGSQAKISMGGQAVVAPPRKPKNLKEANLMAKFLLKGE